MSGPDADGADRAIAKAARRLIPFLAVCYFAAYLDRVNLGFAALTMNRDLGFSPTVYGWGAGIFFLGYALFEVPSNIVMHRFGARLWIARIMIGWGLVSGAMAFVYDSTSFVAMRFLLGSAEAGFAPGIILYLTYWFPEAWRARALGRFLFAIPVSSAVGAPLSGLALAHLDGVLGLHGWQWLFVLEAIPSVLLGVAVIALLTERPARADWLSAEERAAIEARLAEDSARLPPEPANAHWAALCDGKVLWLSAGYFGVVCALYGLGFWLPQIVAGFAYGALASSLLTALPYVCGAAGMVYWTRRCDARGDGFWHTAVGCVVASIGLGAAAFASHPGVALAALCVAAVGTVSTIPVFWTLPTQFLRGAGAAAGIALINSLGNLAGFAAPYAVGWIKETTGGFSVALLALAFCPLWTAAAALALRRWTLAAGAQPA
jgi:MFS transporter, ACS family, tartrate transporter